MRMRIRGVGAVGGFGAGRSALESVLAGGICTPVLEARSQGGPEWAYYRASTDELERFAPKRLLRRMDHFSRLALLCACLALEDAGLEPFDKSVNAGLSVMVASGWGALRTTFSFLDSVAEEDKHASPTHFSNSVHNAAAANIAIMLGATGPSLTVSQFGLSAQSALISAAAMLAAGRAERVLFGAVDEWCDVLGYCRERYFGSEAGEVRPWDFETHSALAGEGAAFFLLEPESTPEGPYGSLLDVRLGTMGEQERLALPDGPLILGADGHVACGQAYADVLHDHGGDVAAYAPLHGSLPSAAALDMAVAAVSVASDTFQAGPDKGGGMRSTSLEGRPVTCLTLGEAESYGLLTVGRSQA